MEPPKDLLRLLAHRPVLRHSIPHRFGAGRFAEAMLQSLGVARLCMLHSRNLGSERMEPDTPELGVHELLVEGHEVFDERSIQRPYVIDEPVHVKEVFILRELRHGACKLIPDILHVRGCEDPAWVPTRRQAEQRLREKWKAIFTRARAASARPLSIFTDQSLPMPGPTQHVHNSSLPVPGTPECWELVEWARCGH